jgi:hypothetical protein
MATTLHDLIPTPKEVLEREPRELAVAVFQVLARLPDNHQELHLYNFCTTEWIPYGSEYKDAIAQAVAEAWQILKNEGLIAETSGDGWVRLTRKGRSLESSSAIKVCLQGAPTQSISPSVTAPRFTLTELWGPLRAAIEQRFSFNDIKKLISRTGVDITSLAHLTQQSGSGGASKGTLMAAIDSLYAGLSPERKELFLRILAEDAIKHPLVESELQDSLARLGWHIVSGKLLPVEVVDALDLQNVPEVSRNSLEKAAVRFRDGDLQGALTAACAAVDDAVGKVFMAKHLGDPAKEPSFQSKVSKALKASGALEGIEQELLAIGWTQDDTRKVCENLRGSINQVAYVMQQLRSRMSDAHGWKVALGPMVFNSLKQAMVIVSLLR